MANQATRLIEIREHLRAVADELEARRGVLQNATWMGRKVGSCQLLVQSLLDELAQLASSTPPPSSPSPSPRAEGQENATPRE